MLFEGEGAQGFPKLTPPRSPFQESEILHSDFRNWAINTNVTKSMSDDIFCVLSCGEIQPQATVASPPTPLYENGEQLRGSTSFSALKSVKLCLSESNRFLLKYD